MKNLMMTMVAVFLVIFSEAQIDKSNSKLAQTPPMGWNSFDSYGVYLHEEAAMANLEAFAEKLQPHGYEYFVIDAGWFGEFKLQPGTIYPAEKHAEKMNFNEYGLLQPSKIYFPNGLEPLIDRCHELGIKFGLHLMRGIPREAVRLNLPVKGTKYTAADIADPTSICSWNPQNYGIDMDKPGAQEFYNSLINQMAEWGVDFIKYDDLVPFPEEIKGIANAIEQCGRPMVFSLSPGGDVDPNHIDAFKRAQMLRVTKDIWDEQKGIDEAFEAWRKWQGKEEPGFWIDMDMIPFGQLQLMSPKPEGLKGDESKGEIMDKIKSGELSNVELLAGKGFNRWSEFTKDQMFTFITMRALAASPLMVGGDLLTLDDFSLSLITHPEMLECNQNGVMGKLIFENDEIEIWKTPQKDHESGWLGIFNRTDKTVSPIVSEKMIGITQAENYSFKNIWEEQSYSPGNNYEIGPNGVIFLNYTIAKDNYPKANLECCQKTTQGTFKIKIEQYLSEAKIAISQTIEQGYKYEAIPKGLKEDGSFHFCGRNWDWMEGFFPGICWYLYDYSGDDKFKEAAEYFQSQYEDHKKLTTHHDLGFIFNNSYGHGFRFTGDEKQKEVMIEAATNLIERYNPNVGSIKSWDTNRGWQAERGWEFPVIIDNMMNLELLFEASLLTNDPKFFKVAVNHANTTLENLFRDDFSSYHVVDFDPTTGEVRKKQTAQGYADNSSWARGQAWGLYGYVLCYRYTKDEKYLDAAEKIASFILNHPNLPADKIPYWDFNAPDIPNEHRDVSAATITASALIELDSYSAKNYHDIALEILQNVHSNYKNERENSILILDHSVGSIPHNSMIDVPIVYADYYYVEALWRLQNLPGK